MSRYPKPPAAEPTTAAAEVVGRRIATFARQIDCSASYVKLEIRRGNIKVAKVGRAIVILTQPAKYLADREVA